ncbi:tripartite tricarboxylate transporter substrate-binding protein [Stieleria varia]|uniref:Tripartite tricarboxylate transporter family receptor n=1 Tax=Stieleria varia TaxID=2528005 RepID=A0A5C6AS46_9BACT|nr:tripartite tricarboxylate transporter substrate binding protein [Stieleria varia]TWU00994.1 Tripartite tricarboxylate transporter family receptor [Stieleria varia]
MGRRVITCSSWLCILFLFVSVAPTGCDSTNQSSNAFPNRPIKLIVPFAAGGGSDTFGRIIQNAIQENNLLDQPLVIVNVPGAGGTIGSRRVKNALPDGYTLLLLHEGMMTAQHSGGATYGPEAFTPIAGTGDATQVIAVAGGSSFQTLSELMQAAKQTPDSLIFAANMGAPSHFAGLMLESEAPGGKFRFTQSGGGAKRFAALQGGHVDVSAFSIAEYVQFQESGLRALALLGESRHPDLPELPTAAEQGFDVVSQNMQFWWAPLGTPPARVAFLADAIESAMKTPAVRQRLAEMKLSDVTLRGDALLAEIKQRESRIAEVATSQPVPLPDFPRIMIVAVITLALLAGFRAYVRKRSSDATSGQTVAVDSGEEFEPTRRPIVVATIAVSTLMYLLALHFGWGGFILATAAYTSVVSGMLARESFARQRLSLVNAVWTIAMVAFVMSVGMHFLFTRVLVVDLP